MAMLEITVDGKQYKVPAGKTVLEAVRDVGVHIPALCEDPRLEPFGACRMCLVEIEGARGPVTACTTRVTQGMVVTTNSDVIAGLRKTAVELLLAEHYGDCVAPCHTACPAGIDIQGFIALIAAEKNAEALQLIKEALPFPAVCGRVCPRFCEDDCRRNLVDKPVAICHLKRYVADIDLEQPSPYMPSVKPDSKKSVGIVGGGPAGLTAAYYLAIEGHRVTVYEAAPELGGMMRYAIPEYRLPRDLLAKEIATITRLCEDVRCNTRLGRDITLDELKARHDAVILTVGVMASQMIPVEGMELPRSYAGLAFLRDAAENRSPDIGERVAVIGGGNTAIDVARTALRLGAKSVTVFYRRSRQEMPASAEEIEHAEEEGVQFHLLANPVRLEGKHGVETIVCTKMELGEPDASGRRRPQPVPDSEFCVAVDSVVWATGQVLDPDGLDGVSLNRWGYISADEVYRTNDASVFAAGDCVTGPTTVVEACGQAHKAAMLVHKYLRGLPVVADKEAYNCVKGTLDSIDPEEYEQYEKIERNESVLRHARERKRDFAEVDPGFMAKQALSETDRCLSCGCQDVNECLLREYATEYGAEKPELLREEVLPVQDDHPFIVRDPNKCVLCGSCVRICAEVTGASALGFTERGFNVVVSPTLGLPLAETACESCMQCISTCPTGALVPKVPLPKPGPWKLEKTQSVCPECSVGCVIDLETYADMLVSVSATVGSVTNNGNLCRKGAFIAHDIAKKPRAAKPMVRKNGELVPTTWADATGVAAKELQSVGPEHISAWLSGRSTSEQAARAYRLVREVLGSQRLLSPACGVAAKLEKIESLGQAATFEHLDKADFVLSVHADLAERFPVAGMRLRQSVKRNDADFISLNTRRTRLDPLASASYAMSAARISTTLRMVIKHILDNRLAAAGLDPERLAKLEMAVAAHIAEEPAQRPMLKRARIAAIAEAMCSAKRPLVVTDLERISGEDLELLSELTWLTGQSQNSLLAFDSSANLRGLLKAQIASCDKCDEEIRQVADANLLIKARGKEKDFCIVLTPYLTDELLQSADVVLPAATFAESSGTFVNAEGRELRLKRAVSPPGGLETCEVITMLEDAVRTLG